MEKQKLYRKAALGAIVGALVICSSCQPAKEPIYKAPIYKIPIYIGNSGSSDQKRFDFDQDGWLSESEVKTSIRVAYPNLSESEIETIMRTTYINKGGRK